ncbi:DNA-binding protein [Actinoalloteichus sp. AHMU CJ021]|uniref:DNA-binding protein, MmcQ/YjbR family n=1 Tax=Actinoalloteichus caeruleus DSM 43889 TaxID=1120930 RepID=A0ABT1JNW2_ACTCY|nr:MmcQ/YjbR family DNA-binding protein [Actinoalloteichus caeruleus]AUS81799.1 DNA-binding protein [Actinoalloteichus sp. AHMU CJ021]MCP2333826.1 putative DNA-binding protein, MmcQ/YjbR family [Actinoalloteichus caeruleus DSM 43889]
MTTPPEGTPRQDPDNGRGLDPRDRVLRLCEELPGVRREYPFGEDTAVFKVGGRIFALVALGGEHGRVTLKCEPEYGALLVDRHPGVIPGYHMNKRHWITVDLAHALPDDLLDELVEDSHDLVVAALPVRARPGVASGRPTGE